MNIVDLRQKNNADNPPEKGENYLTEKDIQQYVNPERRQLLKFLLVGSGAFVLGLLAKSVGFSGLFSKSELKSEIKSGLESGPQQETNLKNWRVIEKNNQVTFIDKKTNEEVLILD